MIALRSVVTSVVVCLQRKWRNESPVSPPRLAWLSTCARAASLLLTVLLSGAALAQGAYVV